MDKSSRKRKSARISKDDLQDVQPNKSIAGDIMRHASGENDSSHETSESVPQPTWSNVEGSVKEVESLRQNLLLKEEDLLRNRVVNSATNSSLLRLLQQQDLKRETWSFRNKTKFMNVEKLTDSQLEACLAHLVGEVGENCQHCTDGQGPFEDCVVVEGFFDGACTNCEFTKSGNTNCRREQSSGNCRIDSTRIVVEDLDSKGDEDTDDGDEVFLAGFTRS